MKWSVHQLQKLRHKGLNLDETIDVSQIKERNSDIREVSPIRVTGRVDFGTNRYTFHLTITGYLILPCVRTLVDVKYPLSITTTETFFTTSEWKSEDENFHILEGDVLDLTPVIEECILAEIPMQIYAEDVEGKETAPMSGTDWEVREHVEVEQKIDPRLAGLAKFFDKQDN
ncbi:YceD family protein [Gottfriedia acidiceleris]|uniref:YceD family protein n=1 Tax=Gottfriedia acidiceleris TaxID=371036 RepID=UPI003D21B0F6